MDLDLRSQIDKEVLCKHCNLIMGVSTTTHKVRVIGKPEVKSSSGRRFY